MEKWKSIFGICQSDHSFAPATLEAGTQRVSIRVNAKGSMIRLKIADLSFITSISVGKYVNGVVTQITQVPLDSKKNIDMLEIAYPVQPHDELIISIYISKCQTVSYFNTFNGQGFMKATFIKEVNVCMDSSYQFLMDATEQTVFGLYGVDLLCSEEVRTIACFGDSITNMSYWTDALVQQLIERNLMGYSILNCGISGNRVLHDTSPNFGLGELFGKSGISRFAHDVFSYSNVDAVIIFMGINDLIHPLDRADLSETVTADQLIDGLLSMAKLAKSHGAYVIGATILPYGNYEFYSKEGNEIRKQVNERLREAKELDAILDFDCWLQDLEIPELLNKAYDFGDGLHINLMGGKTIAEKIIESKVLEHITR